MRRARSGAARERRAHTLTELLIVLFILSLFALLAFPRLASSLMRSRLDVALDALRNDVAMARARAMATGMRHQLLLTEDGREVVVLPWRPAELQTAGTTASPDGMGERPVLRDRLAEEIEVTRWSVSPLSLGTEPGANPGATAQDGAPLLFYPEGYSDSARIVLAEPDGSRRGLLVEGFTGELRELEPEELGP